MPEPKTTVCPRCSSRSTNRSRSTLVSCFAGVGALAAVRCELYLLAFGLHFYALIAAAATVLTLGLLMSMRKCVCSECGHTWMGVPPRGAP